MMIWWILSFLIFVDWSNPSTLLQDDVWMVWVRFVSLFGHLATCRPTKIQWPWTHPKVRSGIYSQMQSKHLKHNRYILPKPACSPGSQCQAETQQLVSPHRKSQNAKQSKCCCFWDFWDVLGCVLANSFVNVFLWMHFGTWHHFPIPRNCPPLLIVGQICLKWTAANRPDWNL